jgi:hypothetical protein
VRSFHVVSQCVALHWVWVQLRLVILFRLCRFFGLWQSSNTPPLYESVLSVRCSIKCQQAVWSQFRFPDDRYYFDYFATPAYWVCLSILSREPWAVRPRPNSLYF